MNATSDRFVLATTAIGTTSLVPEVRLHLASEARGIFQTAENFRGGSDYFPPYWAFAWPGGQALARYLLDHSHIVRGKSVLDIGSGSGISAIAAAKAHAAHVVANDIDPLSQAAIRLNAAENNVALTITTEDILAEAPEAELILIGDLIYEPALATRVSAFLETACSCGSRILLADRTTAKRPPLKFDFLAEYDAPLAPALEELHFERARLWQLQNPFLPKAR